MKALALNCTLKRSSRGSSTQVLLKEVAEALKAEGVDTELLHVLDYEVKPGVSSNEGEGDEWPELRQKILDTQILVIGTPVWLGQPSSVCKRVLERLDAFLGEKDDQGRMVSYGRVALVAIVGNEDGAHHISAEVYQALNDVGFSIAANAVTYWVGEAMGDKDYKDVKKPHKKVAEATAMAVKNAVHLAQALQRSPYPAQQ